MFAPCWHVAQLQNIPTYKFYTLDNELGLRQTKQKSAACRHLKLSLHVAKCIIFSLGMIEEVINYHAGVGVLVKINAPGRRQRLPALIYVENEPYENIWSIGNAKRHDSISVQVSVRVSKGKLEPIVRWLLLGGNPLDSQTTNCFVCHQTHTCLCNFGGSVALDIHLLRSVLYLDVTHLDKRGNALMHYLGLPYAVSYLSTAYWGDIAGINVALITNDRHLHSLWSKDTPVLSRPRCIFCLSDTPMMNL